MRTQDEDFVATQEDEGNKRFVYKGVEELHGKTEGDGTKDPSTYVGGM